MPRNLQAGEKILEAAIIVIPVSTHGDGKMVMASIDHLRRYDEPLFQKSPNETVRRAS